MMAKIRNFWLHFSLHNHRRLCSNKRFFSFEVIRIDSQQSLCLLWFSTPPKFISLIQVELVLHFRLILWFVSAQTICNRVPFDYFLLHLYRLLQKYKFKVLITDTIEAVWYNPSRKVSIDTGWPGIPFLRTTALYCGNNDQEGSWEKACLCTITLWLFFSSARYYLTGKDDFGFLTHYAEHIW